MKANSRRRFLQFLASSPALAHLSAWQKESPPFTLSSPQDALNVMDFEEAARKALPPAHFGYMATGVDDDSTLKRNHEAYKNIQLRPRRLIDVREADQRTQLFGTTWDSPIFLCPVGSQKAFHPQGEVATARAARAKSALMLLSTVSSTSVEDVAREKGTPPWFQLYATSRWEVTEKIVRRAEAAGCPVLVWTVDLLIGRNTETQSRMRRLDDRQCAVCHTASPNSLHRPIFSGIDISGLSLASPVITWDYIQRLKKLTSMKLVLKGIETREDAQMCCDLGADGIIVSNHGGRAEESGRGTIECLPEVVDAVRGRIPVLVDGGIRRGTDVFKALALGARAVGIGRPYIWGLSAFGQPGVERVLELLRAEFTLVMKQCGARSLAEITRASVIAN